MTHNIKKYETGDTGSQMDLKKKYHETQGGKDQLGSKCIHERI
jgi:hypothetical protein